MAEFVSIKGLDQAVKALQLMPRELSGDRGGPVRAGLFAAGKVLRDNARAAAPVGKGTPNPGNLRKQIFLYRDRNPRAIGAAEHYVLSVRTGRKGLSRLKLGAAIRTLTGGDAYYWHFVEFGTSKQAPRPFLRSTFEARKMEALAAFNRTFLAGVSRAEERARIASGG